MTEKFQPTKAQKNLKPLTKKTMDELIEKALEETTEERDLQRASRSAKRFINAR